MKSATSVHAFPLPFSVADGCLQLGGVPITRLAQRIGTTPFYAYDRQIITDTLRRLRSFLPAEVRVHYSIKANPMPALVQHVANLVDGLDVASAGELKTALDTPVLPEHISFTGPGKTSAEILQAVAAGVTIHIESANELLRIRDAALHVGIRPRVMVRVNPDFEIKSSGMKMGGGAKQFGVDEDQVPSLLRQIDEFDLAFDGFHVFSGSQSLNAQALVEAQRQTFALAARLAQHSRQPVRTLNIGGGFGIPYFPGDMPLDLAPIRDNLAMLVPQVHSTLPGLNIVMEFGRYLVGGAGVYVTRIVDRKISRGRVFLVTDGGLNHHLAASGNLGQVIRKNYPVLIGTNMGEAECECVSVVGPLCTPLDLLADKMELPHADVGDLVVVLQSGAYGLTASPTGFLGHPTPAEVLV